MKQNKPKREKLDEGLIEVMTEGMNDPVIIRRTKNGKEQVALLTVRDMLEKYSAISLYLDELRWLSKQSL